MPPLRVNAFSLSADGYGAGPNQDLDNPLGVGGTALHEWMWATRTQQRLVGAEGGEGGVDDDIVSRGFENVGAWIIGRNMFGPVRGPWADESWRGWWGPNPPFHTPVFILTHFPRNPISMDGGTSFHFVTNGIESALRQARAAAGGREIRLGGGVNIIKQFLRARLVDELRVAISPVLLGSGEALFAGIDLLALGYRCTQHLPGSRTTHYVITK